MAYSQSDLTIEIKKLVNKAIKDKILRRMHHSSQLRSSLRIHFPKNGVTEILSSRHHADELRRYLQARRAAA